MHNVLKEAKANLEVSELRYFRVDESQLGECSQEGISPVHT